MKQKREARQAPVGLLQRRIKPKIVHVMLLTARQPLTATEG